MSDRAAALSALADRLADREGVADAWAAKSFTDRLFVVEVPSEGRLPDAVRDCLHDHGLEEADEVYGIEGADDADFAGDLTDGRRYRFVDVRSRGEMQSYVVE
ncbi:hypothetical protein C475_16174 [Halosimplex carlsbadense 2-9-1]|uniref:Uncharacterized protein n=1 Tax=Halosimplex carlsbadense 2-9-1 TaxID=797114 RepID=M0CLF4_9EURY|nr:hypothetical protein [Halosimplex carlsbadense]ELZ23202.1 hypothetical protein C475_16174 [Halosimplex carlsbadense 2-9-1]